MATVALYGPTATLATKIAVGIVAARGSPPDPLERWFSEGIDIRYNAAIGKEILAFLRQHQVLSLGLTERIIGCPHEEGIDYPDGEACPLCPFWAGRDRFTHELVDEGNSE